MSKKRIRSSKKAGTNKASRKGSSARKGAKKPFKSSAKRGIAKSSALAQRAKRAKQARKGQNAAASGTALAVASKEAKKKEFLERMAKARAARTTVNVPAGYKGALPGLTGFVDLGSIPGPASPRRRKKAGKKAKAVASRTVTYPGARFVAPPGSTSVLSPKPGKKKRRSGKKKSRAAKASTRRTASPKLGKKRSSSKKRRAIGSKSRSRKASTPKFKLMHKWGFPSRRPLVGTKRAALRGAAGGTVTAKQILDTIRAEKLKSWVCVGPRRTGCGGGAKNLRGGHQIGIFASSRS